MERFVVQELKGVNRNAVEGVTDAPKVARNVQFKRTGGFIPLGGQRSDWLGERNLGELLLQDSDTLLYETGDPILSNWRPSPSFDERELLAQDDATFALITGPRVWFRNNLWTLPIGEFDEDMKLSLAPRAGILTPWRRVNGEYFGGAVYALQDNQIFAGLGAGSVTYTENAGTGLVAGTYEFVWLVESPTENGLVVHAVGVDDYTVAAEIESLDVEFDEVWEEGTLVRLYYRESTQAVEDGYEQVGVAVCNGLNAPTIVVGNLGTFSPTGDVLVNFAPGKLEAHNGRIWGPAGKDVFVPLLPSGALGQFGGYMSVGSGNQFTVRQFGDVASADMGLRAANDFVRLNISEMRVRRTSRSLPIVVELFNNKKQASVNQQLYGYLQWNVGSREPVFKVAFTVDGVTEYVLMQQTVSLSLLQLGLTINSELILRNVQLTFTIQNVVNNGDGSITSTCILEISVGVPATTYSATVALVGTDTDAFTDWGTYSTAADTFLILGGLPQALVPQCVLGNRYLRVTAIRTGNGSTTYALGDINDYDPSVDLLEWTSSAGEDWETNAASNMIVDYRPTNPDVVTGPRVTANLTLAYSNVGSVNRGTIDNFLVFSPVSSSEITAVTSTPAGLLVFMENETFLVRGDPALQNLESQRLTGTMGNDPGVIPARLGSAVFPVYQGEVYGVNLGGGDVDFGGAIVNLSRDVWTPSDPFVQVVAEPLRNHIVAVTNSGRVYRFDVIVRAWVNDIYDTASDLRYVISACVCKRFGARYNIGSFLDVIDSELVDAIQVKWEDLDMGDKNLMKLWRRLEVFTNGSSGSPVLRWGIRGATGVVNGFDQGAGRWVFTLPRGLVDVKANLELEFTGAGSSFSLEAPIVVEFASRYRER